MRHQTSPPKGSPCAHPGRVSRVRSMKEPTFDHAGWAEGAWDAVSLAFTRASPHVRNLVERGRPDFLTLYTRRSHEGTAIKWLKFHLAYILAYVQNQDEFPPAPDGLTVPDAALRAARGDGRPLPGPREDDGCLCPGPLQTACKFILKRGAAGTRREEGVALDLFNAKRGMPPAPPELVTQALEKHKALISTPRPDIRKKPLDPGFVRTAAELVRKVFKGETYHRGDYCPSFNAAFDQPLMSGGCFRSLVQEFILNELLCDECSKTARDYLDQPASDSHEKAQRSLSDCEFSSCWCRNGLCYRSYGVFGPCPYLTEDLLYAMVEVSPGVIEEMRGPAFGNSLTAEKFQRYVDRVIHARLSSPLLVRRVAIREPLKVRVISAGQAAEYYRCLDFQKLMHRALKRFDVFEFIGKPISESAWLRAFGDYALGDRVRSMISGDYEAATDNLDPRVSEMIWTLICSTVRRPNGHNLISGDRDPLSDSSLEHELRCHRDGYGELFGLELGSSVSEEYLLGLKALTGHCFEETHSVTGPDGKRTRTTDRFTQEWGQLMGSPMSFPILCIANASACLLSLGQAGGNLSFPLRVNGDDCAFAATEEEYRTWDRVTSSIGLKKSVGKNYRSRNFCVMNSEYRRVVPGVGWEYVGYINQGLLRGLTTKGPDAGSRAKLSFLDVGPNISAALRGLEHTKVWDQLVEYGIKEHKDTLLSCPKEISWWAPQHLGGLGLPCRDVGAAIKGRPFADQAAAVAGYATSSPAVQLKIPVPVRFRGPLADAVACARKLVPTPTRIRRVNTSVTCELGDVCRDFRQPKLHEGLGGSWLLEALIRVPFTAKGWSSVESMGPDNRALRTKWERWARPALHMAVVARKGDEPNRYSGFDWNVEHQRYESVLASSTPSGGASRETLGFSVLTQPVQAVRVVDRLSDFWHR